ncbi:MAG: anthranilate synthase component I [Phycisphaerales bacterium]|nr:anthranilate synthase component I [Phycisphaerales bacterium]
MATYDPPIEKVRELSGRGKTVPIFRRLLADQMTPVGAFVRLSQGTDHAFLLESVVGGEQIARYSFVGANPSAIFRAKRDTAWIKRLTCGEQERQGLSDPLAELHKLLDEFKAVPREDMSTGLLPLPRFTGGAVGFAGYDTIRYYEDLTQCPPDDRGLDDLSFGIYDSMVIFDHVNKTILVVAHVRLDQGDIDQSYDDACRRIDELVTELHRPAAMTSDFDLAPSIQPGFESNFTQARFEEAVRKSIDYIIAGDIFQVVLSQRLRVDYAADPFDIYRALRVVNPSPFMFYVKSPSNILIGASPEILCRVEDGRITNRPLAGTRRRGTSPAEDHQLEKELLKDPKDRAEHIMLVDLGRNDVGRVAEPGTIQLTEVMNVERYSHVMHISSNVSGRLATGYSAMDALRAALPVGTVSGAPKIRAMEIIDELEPCRRGPYGGAVGYFDFAGNMDTCIALRTMVVTPGREAGHWTVDIQAGAGIVADSDPSAEYEETLNKARALLSAIAVAGN